MKGYVVCVYKTISSEEKLKEYAVKARTAVEKYKGKFLVKGGSFKTNEGDKSYLHCMEGAKNMTKTHLTLLRCPIHLQSQNPPCLNSRLVVVVVFVC